MWGKILYPMLLSAPSSCTLILSYGFCFVFNCCFPLSKSLHWASSETLGESFHLWPQFPACGVGITIPIPLLFFVCPGVWVWQGLPCYFNSVGLSVHKKCCVLVPWDWHCWRTCGHLVYVATMYPESGMVITQIQKWYVLSGYSSMHGRELV